MNWSNNSNCNLQCNQFLSNLKPNIFFNQQIKKCLYKKELWIPFFIIYITFLFSPGNSNLVYTIIRKRQVFHSLASLPSDYGTIAKNLTKRSRKHLPSTNESENGPESPSMEGSRPALPAEPGTLKVLDTFSVEIYSCNDRLR